MAVRGRRSRRVRVHVDEVAREGSPQHSIVRLYADAAVLALLLLLVSCGSGGSLRG